MAVSQPQPVCSAGASRPGPACRSRGSFLWLADLSRSWLSSLQSGLALRRHSPLEAEPALPPGGASSLTPAVTRRMCLNVALLSLPKGFRFWETRDSYSALGSGKHLGWSGSVGRQSKPRCPLPPTHLNVWGKEQVPKEHGHQAAGQAGPRGPRVPTLAVPGPARPHRGRICTPKAGH